VAAPVKAIRERVPSALLGAFDGGTAEQARIDEELKGSPSGRREWVCSR
jgi:hypothetical protein